MSREFDTPNEIEDWTQSLDQRWPERLSIKDHLVKQIKKHTPQPTSLVELCSGDGSFARKIQLQLPGIHYIGLDASQSLTQYANTRASQHQQFFRADLNQSSWQDLLPDSVACILALQSYHDVGGPEAIAEVYQRSYARLRPGGLWLMADFIIPEGETSEQPGRLPLSWHVQTLTGIGFSQVRSCFSKGLLRCYQGVKG
jgi:ubiquinone/menaquinone biosynthesis C-methylase UbiE